MKKCFTRLIYCALAAACAITFSACSSDKATSSGAAGSASSTVSAVSETSAVESSQAAAVNTKFATVEEFVNSDIMQEQLNSVKSSIEGSGISLEITGTDNTLTYSFIYEDLGDTNIEELAAALNSTMDSMESTYADVADSLKDAVDVESPVVIVSYVTADGTEICSREFTAAE